MLAGKSIQQHDIRVHGSSKYMIYKLSYTLSRRGIDSLRRLDRFQCRVTQYRGENLDDDNFRPVLEVVEEAATILNRYFSPIVLGANVSGTII